LSNKATSSNAFAYAAVEHAQISHFVEYTSMLKTIIVCWKQHFKSWQTRTNL